MAKVVHGFTGEFRLVVGHAIVIRHDQALAVVALIAKLALDLAKLRRVHVGHKSAA